MLFTNPYFMRFPGKRLTVSLVEIIGSTLWLILKPHFSHNFPSWKTTPKSPMQTKSAVAIWHSHISAYSCAVLNLLCAKTHHLQFSEHAFWLLCNRPQLQLQRLQQMRERLWSLAAVAPPQHFRGREVSRPTILPQFLLLFVAQLWHWVMRKYA